MDGADLALSALKRIFNEKFFRRTGIAACSSVFLLFVLGGLVRVTGSGMGCPDWPKCFGLLAPPTCSCELPANYQQIFLKQRVAKLNRFANTLEALGMSDKARVLRNDKKLLEPEEFNAFKAWTEYINRLFGVLAGLFSLAFTLLAFRRIKEKPGVALFAALGFVMLLFNAWLGSIVVATNLLPGIVTIHFLFSFLCIFFFLTALNRNSPFGLLNDDVKIRGHWMVLCLMVLFEVILGTLAREQVEVLKAGGGLTTKMGDFNVEGMGFMFVLHRYFPLILIVYALRLVRRKNVRYAFQNIGLILIVVLSVMQMLLGAANIFWVLPGVTQVLHIVLGAFLPIWVFYFVLAKPGEHSVVNTTAH